MCRCLRQLHSRFRFEICSLDSAQLRSRQADHCHQKERLLRRFHHWHIPHQWFLSNCQIETIQHFNHRPLTLYFCDSQYRRTNVKADIVAVPPAPAVALCHSIIVRHVLYPDICPVSPEQAIETLLLHLPPHNPFPPFKPFVPPVTPTIGLLCTWNRIINKNYITA